MKTTIDAVKHHNSVWPYDKNYSYMMQNPQGYYRQSSLDGTGEFGTLVCTREEFEAAAGSVS